MRAIYVLVGIAIVGVVGYVTIEGWPYFDALYMTVMTLTTVGYGEVRTLSPLGRAFTILLMVSGIGAMLYTLTTVMQYVVEGHFGEAVGRRRMKDKITKLSNHYVLCGYGRVGREIAFEFKREGIPFVVIDINQESLVRCGQDGCLNVPGDASTDEVLNAAGIERARGLIAAVDSDAHNVYVTLSARGLRQDLFIVARGSTDDSGDKLRRAGANRVISPYSIAGRRMAMLALRPVVIDFIDTVMHSENLELLLESVEVRQNSPVLGLTIEQARERRPTSPHILAVRKHDGRMVARPDPSTTIELGDHIVLIGTQEELRSLESVF